DSKRSECGGCSVNAMGLKVSTNVDYSNFLTSPPDLGFGVPCEYNEPDICPAATGLQAEGMSTESCPTPEPQELRYVTCSLTQNLNVRLQPNLNLFVEGESNIIASIPPGSEIVLDLTRSPTTFVTADNLISIEFIPILYNEQSAWTAQ